MAEKRKTSQTLAKKTSKSKTPKTEAKRAAVQSTVKEKKSKKAPSQKTSPQKAPSAAVFKKAAPVSKPKANRASLSKSTGTASLPSSFKEKKFPRVEVIKKSDVLLREKKEAEFRKKEELEPTGPSFKKTEEEVLVKKIQEEESVPLDYLREDKLKALAERERKIQIEKAEAALQARQTQEEKNKLRKETQAKLAQETKKRETFSETESKFVREGAVRTAVETAAAPEEAAPPKELMKASVRFPITPGELAPKINKTANELIKHLMQKGILMSINQRLEDEFAKKTALEFGYELEIVDPLELEIRKLEEQPEEPGQLKPKPPVVTVMGHVDHGKTSLLDAIRETNVAASEVGGITQRIGAYQVELKERKITFLDTPGHEAFTSMRARGAKVTDVAVLVVAADDGVMPQTDEAIDHAKAANIPIVTAINKIDKPDANVDRVKQQLSERGLLPEEWGGSSVMVPISARDKKGIQELLEMILLVADLAELKANPEKSARGTIIEANLDRGKGPIATVLVQEGTFRIGDSFVAGNTYGKVRAFINDRGERVLEVPPGTPVEIIGLNDVPTAGDILQAIPDEKMVRQIAEARSLHTRERLLASLPRVSLDDLYEQIQKGAIKELNVILKADSQGSVEALKEALERLSTEEVRVRLIHTGVGIVTESDVMLAFASNAVILGYNIRPEPHIKNLAEREKVELRFYRVIYQAIEEITQALVGMRKPMVRENTVGRAEILEVFRIAKTGNIAGCRVTDGKIGRDTQVRVIRDGAVVFEGKISSLKRFKEDTREVSAGYECGIGVERFQDLKVGDIIESFALEEIRHTTLVGESS